MNGIEVTKIIRSLSIPSKSNIPIIAFTGNIQSDDIKNYLKAGMNDCLGKPIAFEQISEILLKVENEFYLLKNNSNSSIDFVDTEPEMTEDELKNPNQDVSPLAIYTARMSSADIQSNFEQIQDSNFMDEDSFESAVKQFEENEKVEVSAHSKTYSKLSDSGLDENILMSLRSGLSIEQIQEILISFYEKSDELIAAIGNAYLEENAIALNARAHELKGMAGNFGFSELSRMCAVIERAGKENNLAIAKSEVDGLGEHYAIARGNLNKWLNKA
jgi:CheY-like chemotaxis protein